MNGQDMEEEHKQQEKNKQGNAPASWRPEACSLQAGANFLLVQKPT